MRWAKNNQKDENWGIMFSLFRKTPAIQVKETVEPLVIDALRKRDFKNASMLVASYEASQPKSRGVNVDWKKHNPSRNIGILSGLYNGKPKILNGLDDKWFEQLREIAGLELLWGTNKPWIRIQKYNFEVGRINAQESH